MGATLHEVIGDRAAAARHEQLVRVLATGERVRYEAEFRERALLITLFRIDANTVGSEAFDITELRRGELRSGRPRRATTCCSSPSTRGSASSRSVREGASRSTTDSSRPTARSSSQTGLDDAAGKQMRELAPEHEEHWFQIYGRVAVTGEANPVPEPRRGAGTDLRRLRLPRGGAREPEGRHPLQ